jgi:uncharacterized RDD family membrane protein YckC
MENNIVNLVEHINKKKEVETFNQALFSPLKLEKQKITQRRIYSFMVDFSSILVISAAIQTSYIMFVNEFLYSLKFQAKSALILENSPVQFSVFLLSFTAYFLYSLYVMDGQTFGKKVFNLRAIKDDFLFDEEVEDGEITLRDSFRRTMGYLACYMSFGAFFLFSIMSEDKRGLPDYFSGTRTVSEELIESIKLSKLEEKEAVTIDIESLRDIA